MFYIILFIGGYSYLVAALGFWGRLSETDLIVSSVLYLGFYLLLFRKKLKVGKGICEVVDLFGKYRFISFLFALSILINLAGVLLPETSFDALWYHLTIPKIFIEKGRIVFIKGGLFYYSLLPKNIEMIYLVLIKFGNENLVKFVHFFFGLLSSYGVYRVGRIFLRKKESYLAGLCFYTMPVVSWLSGSGYIDLGRSFFEIFSIYYFLLYLREREKKQLIFSGIVMGLALAVKTLVLGSLIIVLVVLLLTKECVKTKIKDCLVFLIAALVFGSFWYLVSYYFTGDFFYPIFSGILDENHQVVMINFTRIISDFYKVFMDEADFLTPCFLIALPIVFMMIRKMNLLEKKFLAICLLSYLVWYITPRTGGGRFFISYGGLFIVLGFIGICRWGRRYLKVYEPIVIVSIVLNMSFRGISVFRSGDFLLRNETKKDYLSNNLSFKTNVFYDIDGFFDNIDGRILIYCSHNLFYADFNFIHESYYEGEEVGYIMTQNCQLPDKYESKVKNVYENKKSGIKLYKI